MLHTVENKHTLLINDELKMSPFKRREKHV